MLLLLVSLAISFSFTTQQTTLYITGSGTLSASLVTPNCDMNTITVIHVGEGCTALTTGTFYNFASLVDLYLPSTLQTITGSDTNYCFKLANIYLPSGSNYLELDTYGALYTKGLVKLIRLPPMKTSFAFSSQTTTIGERSMQSCRKISTLNITNSITSVANMYLYDSYFTKIYIETGSSLTSITNWGHAFKLTYIFIAKSVISIASGAFSYNYLLKTIEFETGSVLTTINSNAFYFTVFEKFVFPPNCTTISSYLFNLVTTLKYIYIPASLISINTQAFTGAQNIQTIEIDPNNPAYTVISPATLMLKDGTKFIYIPPSSTNFTIPASVTDFGYTMFQSCTQLTSINVNSSSKSFAADAGIVYNKAYTKAIACIGGITKVSLRTECTSNGDYCFYQCTLLTSVILNEGLLTIGTYSFYATNFTEINFTSTIKSLGSYCFYKSLLANVTINGGGPATISTFAFDLTKITEIHFGINLASLGSYAFYSTPLTTITFDPDCPLSSIPSITFYLCTKLVSIEIPKNVLTMYDRCFYYTSSLKNVTFSEGSKLYYIDSQVFLQSSIALIILPSSLTSLGANCFSSCTKLVNVTFETGINLTTLGGGVFKSCTSLKNITIPASVTTFDASAFIYCTSLTDIIVESNNENYTSYNGIVYTKDKEKLVCCPGGKTTALVFNYILVIGSNAFYGCSKLQNLSFEDGCHLETIEDGTFYSCTALVRVDLPTSLQTVKQNAFQGCTKLAIITFPDYSLANLAADSIFADCSSLTTFTFGKYCALTAFGSNIFSNCVKLATIVIPANCSSIGDGAFSNCVALSNITFESNSHMTSLSNTAFSGCTALLNYTVPDSFTQINSSCFGGATAITIVNIAPGLSITKIASNAFSAFPLKYINFGKGTTVSKIDDSAFLNRLISSFQMDSPMIISSNALKGCTKLTSISVLGAKSIGSAAFSGCTLLSSFTVSKTCTSLGSNRFYGCTSLSRIEFISTSTVSSIGDNSFYGCTKITNIQIPKSVLTIGSKAFYGCSSLLNISFASNCVLSSIGANCFSGCTSLTNFTIPDSFINITKSTFGSAPSIRIVNVPANMSIILIGSNAFDSFPLEYFNIGPGTTISCIDQYGFANTKIHSFSLECEVIVSAFAFQNCTNLTTVNMTQMKSYSSLSAAKRKLKSSSLSQEFYTIPEGLFDGCICLESLSINNNIDNISGYAFRNCNVLQFTIPSSVTSIGNSAFENCYKVKIIPNYIVYFGNSSFKGAGISRTLKINSNVSYIGEFTFFNTSLRIVYYCGDTDFSGFSRSFDDSTSIVVTFSYPKSTFCGATVYHMPSNSCSDIMQTNNDANGLLKRQIGEKLNADGIFLASVYYIGLW